MLKQLLKVSTAGTIGFLSIIGGYFVLPFDLMVPVGSSDARFIAVLLLPVPIGGLIAWVVYRVLDG